MNTVNYLTQFRFMGMWYLIWVCTDGTEILEAIFDNYDDLEYYAMSG